MHPLLELVPSKVCYHVLSLSSTKNNNDYFCRAWLLILIFLLYLWTPINNYKCIYLIAFAASGGAPQNSSFPGINQPILACWSAMLDTIVDAYFVWLSQRWSICLRSCVRVISVIIHVKCYWRIRVRVSVCSLIYMRTWAWVLLYWIYIHFMLLIMFIYWSVHQEIRITLICQNFSCCVCYYFLCGFAFTLSALKKNLYYVLVK